jgi:hypothetical protein
VSAEVRVGKSTEVRQERGRGREQARGKKERGRVVERLLD